MPIYDYICPKCKKEHANKLVSHGVKVFCGCGQELVKKICAPNISGMDNLGRSK